MTHDNFNIVPPIENKISTEVNHNSLIGSYNHFLETTKMTPFNLHTAILAISKFVNLYSNDDVIKTTEISYKYTRFKYLDVNMLLKLLVLGDMTEVTSTLNNITTTTIYYYNLETKELESRTTTHPIVPNYVDPKVLGEMLKLQTQKEQKIYDVAVNNDTVMNKSTNGASQELASATTYAKRYNLANLLGVRLPDHNEELVKHQEAEYKNKPYPASYNKTSSRTYLEKPTQQNKSNYSNSNLDLFTFEGKVDALVKWSDNLIRLSQSQGFELSLFYLENPKLENSKITNKLLSSLQDAMEVFERNNTTDSEQYRKICSVYNQLAVLGVN